MIKHKFKAKPTNRNSIRFDSKKEAEYYDSLLMAQKAGIVLFFIRQPSFDLPGGVKYKADFMVFMNDGSVRIIDVKGYKTPEYKVKKKIVESMYPITIEEV